MGTPITFRETIVGLKRAYSWGTAKACAATDGLLITSESIKTSREHLEDDSAGLAFKQNTDKGKPNSIGTLAGYARYEGLDVALALIMGTAGIPQSAGNGAYTNTFTLDTTIEGKFGTLAIKKKSDIIEEYPSIKFTGLKLSGSMHAPVTYSIDCIANKRVLDSVINTTTTMASVTYPTSSNRIIMDANSYFRINDNTGIALNSSHNIYPSNFEFSFSRPVEGDFTPESEYISEPTSNGFPETTLTLKFPRYNDANHAFFADWDAYTEKKIEINFRGALIGGTNYYYFRIQIPKCKIIDPENAMSNSGKIPFSLTFKCLGCTTAPNGMTGATNPWQLLVQNTRSTDPDSSSSSSNSSSSSSLSSSSSSCSSG